MMNLSQAGIEANEVVDWLKKELQIQPILQNILHQKIIAKTAGERGVTVSDEEIQAEGDRFRLEYRLEKASDTLAWLAERTISANEWEAGIRDRLLKKKLAVALFDKEVEKCFAEHRLEFDKILLYQIIVPYEKVAREVLYQIEEQEISFYEAAHLYDMDERRRLLCGFEGKIPRSRLQPDIAAAVFSTPLHEIVGPLKTDLGYHLFLAEELIRAELTSEIRQQIIDRLFAQWLSMELNYTLHNQQL